MLDPFPIPPIAALSRAVQPWACRLNLTALPLHIHEILLSFLVFELTNAVISPALSRRLFPVKYASLSKRRKINWNARVVSSLQSTVLNILSLWVILNDKERESMNRLDRVYGYTGASGMAQALATGYFLWDLCRTAPNIEVFGVGTVAHAISAVAIYMLGFRPLINFYSCNFLLWQLSTPFVNIHWFLDKLDMTGSRAQLINGILLVITFFSCRLIYGTSQTAAAFYDVWVIRRQETAYVPGPHIPGAGFPAHHESKPQFVTLSSRVPFWLCLAYLTAGATLTYLNFYWFFKIIMSLRKRFDSKNEKPQVARGVTKTSDKAFTTCMAQPKKPSPTAD